jgi:hypothetical protein
LRIDQSGKASQSNTKLAPMKPAPPVLISFEAPEIDIFSPMVYAELLFLRGA